MNYFNFRFCDEKNTQKWQRSLLLAPRGWHECVLCLQTEIQVLNLLPNDEIFVECTVTFVI